MKKLLLLFVGVLCLTACTSKKDILYMQNIDQHTPAQTLDLYTEKYIQVNDILKIDVTALNEESLTPFKFKKTQAMGATNLNGPAVLLEGYLVNKDGAIDYPGLGNIQAAGLTTQELKEVIELRLQKFVRDAQVKVRLVNFKFTVLGEVKAPGTYSITDENISIPQALGMAGDLTIQADRNHILLVREINGERVHQRIDLTQTDWMNSPYYFLKQNDILYVTPNTAKVKSAGIVGNLGTLLSVFSILLSSAVLIFR
ncbi:polysaccharide biosynthesis/export family protein [uncultured Mesonia sp.]|uniref:polysaccharide biosynthesis/export family protein n=1 Tax=uncultured Mesonia sp. TaxID=399731 RepID=UPI00374F315A